ncbi:MAG: glycosyltransferase family 4 protein [Planctomycetes bacterium]|nr:glycosyltransferase family 4 protein [Planctomycetota bacterium]
MTPTKILFFMNILRDGAGMINRELGFIDELSQRNYQVTILSYFRPNSSYSNEKVSIQKVLPFSYYSFLYERLFAYPLIFILLFFKFLRLRPQVVFVDLHQEAFWALVLRRFFRYKVVFTYHGVANSKFYTGHVATDLDRIRKKSHKLLKKCDQVIVVSDFLLQETSGIDVSATRIHNGVNPQLFSPQRCYKSIINAGTNILFIGRFTAYKGAINIVKAFASIAAKSPQSELIMHGYHESEEYMNAIQTIISDNNLQDRVHIHGPISGSEMAYKINNASIFVNGSTDETFCMPLLEAQSCHCPCVAFAAGGIPEVVNHNATGLLADEDDLDGFAQHMLSLLSDSQLHKKLQDNCQSHVNSFHYSVLVKQLESVLENIT